MRWGSPGRGRVGQSAHSGVAVESRSQCRPSVNDHPASRCPKCGQSRHPRVRDVDPSAAALRVNSDVHGDDFSGPRMAAGKH